MTFGLHAARRFALISGTLVVLGIAPLTSAVTAGTGTSYSATGHAWMSLDSSLRSPSHISAWSIDQYLARDTPLPPLGQAFKAAETSYNVNALYLLAHAMHETAFGTSYISLAYHNLFGWNAADRNPSGLATRFPTYAASIDYVASQISELYLSPTGKFYGGAPTLRGMHHYASDPMWAQLIAQIANGIVLPTLAQRGITFDDPIVGDASVGQDTVVTLTTKTGSLPDGLQVGYRWVPVAIVEAGAPNGATPDPDPAFAVAKGQSSNDQLRVTIQAPGRAGRYRLQLQLRDSDGTELTEYGVPQIPDEAIRVYGSDAVSYEVGQSGDRLTVTVTNEGRRLVPATGTAAGGLAGATPTRVATTLTAYLVDAGGTPTILGTAQLSHALKPGASWTTHFAAPASTTLPAIVLVRLVVGGDAQRLGGSPPGVFQIAADGSTKPASAPATAAPSAPAPSPTATDPTATDPAATDPTATDPAASDSATAAPTANAQTTSTNASPTASGDPSSDSSATATTSALAFGALTPVDATTRELLYPDWDPANLEKFSGQRVANGNQAKATRLRYQPIVSPDEPGWATIRITNVGTAPLLATVPTTDTPTDPTAASEPGPTTDQVIPTATLLVTAIPAWGPATDAIVIQVPVLIDIDPGRTLDVGITLPPTPGGQSSYLIVARVIPVDGGKAFPPTLFWLRGPLALKPGATSPSTPTPQTPTPAASPADPGADPSATLNPNGTSATAAPSAAGSVTAAIDRTQALAAPSPTPAPAAAATPSPAVSTPAAPIAPSPTPTPSASVAPAAPKVEAPAASGAPVPSATASQSAPDPATASAQPTPSPTPSPSPRSSVPAASAPGQPAFVPPDVLASLQSATQPPAESR